MWRLQIEQESNLDEGVVDYCLEAELEEELDEQADYSIAHELVHSELEYSVAVEDMALVSNTALNPVPKSVLEELAAYAAYRMEPFARHRAGGQVVTTTVEGDRSNALRFLGYMKSECDQTPTLKMFADPRIGRWTEQWMVWLAQVKGLRASTIAVYCNGIISVSTYALTLVDDPAVCPMIELLNLRYAAECVAL